MSDYRFQVFGERGDVFGGEVTVVQEFRKAYCEHGVPVIVLHVHGFLVEFAGFVGDGHRAVELVGFLVIRLVEQFAQFTEPLGVAAQDSYPDYVFGLSLFRFCQFSHRWLGLVVFVMQK